MAKYFFDHEKLKVYQKAIEFVNWSTILQDKIKLKDPIIDQLKRASYSIPLNISEGNGRFSSKDRCHFFDIAKGSALESSSCLDIIKVKKLTDTDDIDVGKKLLSEIVSMLVGLIKSNSNRVYELEQNYSIETTRDLED
jgi:four helix bundle protein